MLVRTASYQNTFVEEQRAAQLNAMEALTVLNVSTKPCTNFNFNAHRASLRKIKHVLKVFFFKAFSAPISIGRIGVLLTSIVFHVSQKLLCLN